MRTIQELEMEIKALHADIDRYILTNNELWQVNLELEQIVAQREYKKSMAIFRKKIYPVDAK